MKHFIFLLCSFFLLYGCNKTSHHKNMISANIDNTNSISITDIFSKARIIPLETTDESLIGNIYSLLKYEGHIYILDNLQNIVLVFDENGHFIFKINKKGRGPGEYQFLSDMKINIYNHTIELLDPMGKLLIFDMSGKYINTIRLPSNLHAYHEFIPLNKDSILFHCDSENFILNTYSRNCNKIIRQDMKKERKLSIGTPVNPFYSYQDTVFFSMYLSDKIYSITSNGPEVAYEWYFPQYDYEAEAIIPDFDRSDYKQFKNIVNNIPYVYINNLQNKYYKYTIIRLAGKRFINIFHDKQKKSNIIFEKTTEGLSFTSNFMDNFTSINCIYPSDIQQYNNLSILDEESEKYLKAYSENDNIILIEYSFK